MESYVKNQKFHLIIHHKVKRVLFAIFFISFNILVATKGAAPFFAFFTA